MARDLNLVIDEMLKVIPEDQTDLIDGLQKLQQKIKYSAPELMTHRWNETAYALNVLAPGINTDWKQRLAEIFSGHVKQLRAGADEVREVDTK